MRLRKVKDAYKIVNNSEYFIKEPNIYKGVWKSVFENNNPIHVEIGMGKGQFITGMAEKYPNINFIGIEMYDSVLARAVQKLNERECGLKNLKFIQIDARYIDDIFDREISRIYLNFSDPWPKAKHAKRRLTSKEFLEKYENIFVNEKVIFQKTDNIDLFDFSIDSFEKNGYVVKNISRDLHSENILDNILTEYEEKFSAKGVKINRLEAYKS